MFIGIQLSHLFLPMDQRVSAKLTQLVNCGVRRMPEIRRHLQHYVESDLFAGRAPPPQTDARYWPSNRTLLNAIHRVVQSSRLEYCVYSHFLTVCN